MTVPDAPHASSTRHRRTRPGPGRPPGPSEVTIARWTALLRLLGRDLVLGDTLSDRALMRRAAARAAADGDPVRAADFERVARRLGHGRGRPAAAPLHTKSRPGTT